MKTNETYLPLKRPSAGPFFKSTLAEIYFTIYKQLMMILLLMVLGQMVLR